jgi:hypothetical protein
LRREVGKGGEGVGFETLISEKISRSVLLSVSIENKEEDSFFFEFNER